MPSHPSLLLAQAGQAFDMREFIDGLARTPLSEVVIFVSILTALRLVIFPFLKNTVLHRRGTLYGGARFVNELLDAFVYAGVFVFMLIRPFAIQAFLIPSGSMVETLLVNDFIVANKAIYRYSDPKPGDIVVFRPPARAILDPRQLTPEGEAKVDFIKRCVGGPGDLVEIKDGVLYRNGQRVDEPYKRFTETRDGVSFRELSDQEIQEMTLASFKLVELDGRLIPLNFTKYDTNSPDPQRGFLEPWQPYGVAQEYQIVDPEVMRKARDLPAQKIPKGYYLMVGDNRNGSFDGRGWGLVPRDAIVGRSEFIWMPFNRWQQTR